VKLSVKSDYAARAVLGLARHHASGRAVRVESLAEEQGIPPKYLVQILIELKGQQIVKSVRGKEGGYLLAKAPSEVSMGDVLRCINGTVFDTPALEDPNCPEELQNAWRKMQIALETTADGLNFEELSEDAERQKMFYI